MLAAIAAIATMVTVTNTGLYLVIWLVRIGLQGRKMLGAENLRETIFLFVFLGVLIFLRYLIWLFPLQIDLLNGARRTYWVLVDNIKSDLSRYLLTFLVCSGEPPVYELIEISSESFIYDFQSPNYSLVGYLAAVLWVLILFVGIVFSIMRRDPYGLVGVLVFLYFILLHYGFHSKGSVFLFVLQFSPAVVLIVSCAIREVTPKLGGIVGFFRGFNNDGCQRVGCLCACHRRANGGINAFGTHLKQESLLSMCAGPQSFWNF